MKRGNWTEIENPPQSHTVTSQYDALSSQRPWVKSRWSTENSDYFNVLIPSGLAPVNIFSAPEML